MVAVLPLHTVFLSAWISWKPYLVLLVVLAGWDILSAGRARTWPWHPRVAVALGIFAAALLVGFPVAAYRERFMQLYLALAIGGLVMLTVERHLRTEGMLDRMLGVIYWTAGAMGLTAIVFELVAVGAFGSAPIGVVNEVPGVYRFFKPAYLDEGFLALTNWHQDPGYSAAWSVLWSVPALFAMFRRPRPWWLDSLVLGGLAFAVLMAFSRTGWLSWPIAITAASLALIRRWGVTPSEVLRRVGAGVLVALVLTAGIWALDRPETGGDIDLQLAFRFSQGFDLVASITGLFATSDAFEDRFSVSEERADVWPEYWQMFRENPITGVGLGVGWLTTSISQEPHNLALELLGETGLLGTVAFLILLGVILASGGGAIGGVALLGAFLHSVTQTVLFEPTWWFAAGLYISSQRSTVDKDRESSRVSAQRRAEDSGAEGRSSS